MIVKCKTKYERTFNSCWLLHTSYLCDLQKKTFALKLFQDPFETNGPFETKSMPQLCLRLNPLENFGWSTYQAIWTVKWLMSKLLVGRIDNYGGVVCVSALWAIASLQTSHGIFDIFIEIVRRTPYPKKIKGKPTSKALVVAIKWDVVLSSFYGSRDLSFACLKRNTRLQTKRIAITLGQVLVVWN